MKIFLSLLVLPALLFVGCMNNSSDITSPDQQIKEQSTSPNWVILPGDPGQGLGVETVYFAEKLIKGKRGGHIKLNIKIRRPGHEFGDYVVKAKVKVEKNSFPDDEEILFTITMDPDNAYLNISPSPNTLYKHIRVDWEIKGIDVSHIVLDNFDYFYVSDNMQILTTSKQDITVDYNKHKIKLKNGIIHPTTTKNSPGGTRYGFVNRR
jgi:hypothetical protein